MEYVNCTPNDIVLKHLGKIFSSNGVEARVVYSYHQVSDHTLVRYPDRVEGLPEPEAGYVYIVSQEVVDHLRRKRNDLVVPAIDHPDAFRNDEGRLHIVPGFIIP